MRSCAGTCIRSLVAQGVLPPAVNRISRRLVGLGVLAFAFGLVAAAVVTWANHTWWVPAVFGPYLLFVLMAFGWAARRMWRVPVDVLHAAGLAAPRQGIRFRQHVIRALPKADPRHVAAALAPFLEEDGVEPDSSVVQRVAGDSAWTGRMEALRTDVAAGMKVPRPWGFFVWITLYAAANVGLLAEAIWGSGRLVPLMLPMFFLWMLAVVDPLLFRQSYGFWSVAVREAEAMRTIAHGVPSTSTA